MMRLGFTGTREGMTTAQLHTFREFLFRNVDVIDEFHHGCCIRADTEAHLLVFAVFESFMDIESMEAVMHYHPPTNTDYMTDLRSFPGTWHTPKPYLERNHNIVDATTVLIAGPKADEEELRSGTWATMRYARRLDHEVKQLRRMGGWV